MNLFFLEEKYVFQFIENNRISQCRGLQHPERDVFRSLICPMQNFCDCFRNESSLLPRIRQSPCFYSLVTWGSSKNNSSVCNRIGASLWAAFLLFLFVRFKCFENCYIYSLVNSVLCCNWYW